MYFRKIIICMMLALGVMNGTYPAPKALAQTPADQMQADLTVVLEGVWQKHLVLSQTKQNQLVPLFSDAAARITPNGATIWMKRVGPLLLKPNWENPYTQEALEAFNALGATRFYAKARAASPPFTTARLDLILAVAETKPSQTGPALDLLLDIAHGEDGFTRDMFANGAMYLAVLACDTRRFNSAAGLKTAPLNTEEASWQARLSGDTSGITQALEAQDSDDSGPIRAALRGLVFLDREGYCK